MSLYLKKFNFGTIIKLLLAFLVCWGWSYLELLKNIPADLSNNPEYFIIFGITFYLLRKFALDIERRLLVFSVIGGLLLSMSFVFGTYLHYKNYLFGTDNNVMMVLFLVISLLPLTIPAFIWFFEKISLLSMRVFEKKGKEIFTHKISSYFLRFFIYWICIFLLFLPIYLTNWPGNFIFDSKYQLKEVISNAYTTHHPILHTWLLGFFYKYGDQALANVSKGVSYYTLLQMLVVSFSFAYCLLFLYKKEFSFKIRAFTFVFFAIYPLNPMFSITATKDVLFAAFFLLFFVLLLEVLEKLQQETFLFNPSYLMYIVCLWISGTFMVLLRNNAKYALMLTIPFFLFFTKKWKNKIMLIVVSMIMLLSANLFNNIMSNALNTSYIESRKEALSVPLQQLGRVASYQKDTLDEGIYVEISAYIEEARFPLYNPYNSDSIKNTANEELLRSNFSNFIKLWAKVGVQYPGEYFDSFFTNTMGYWYLGDSAYRYVDDLAAFHTLIDGENIQQIEKKNYSPILGSFYNWFFMYINHRKIPIVSYTFNSALYIWILGLFFLYNLYKKRYVRLLPFSLLVFYVISCFFGPVVMLRYVYNIVVCMPLTILFILDSKFLQKTNSVY